MKNKTKNKNEFIEIDLKRIWYAIWHRIWMVAVSAVLCAIMVFFITFQFVTPKYESSAMFYVNNNSVSVGDASFSITSGDISAAKSLVDTYIVILNSKACLNSVIDYAGVDMTYSDLKSMLSAGAVNSTEIFRVTVTSDDPKEAEKLANAIAYILPKRISTIVEGTAAKVVDHAVKASSPSSPDYTKNAVMGFLIGLALSVVVIALREIFDVTIRDEEDIERCCDYPILSSVPDMLSNNQSSGSYYGYGAKSSGRHHHASNKKKSLIGKDISFVATEAYKLLRTKLEFSFVEGVSCPVIGVSSALAGEGKSLSAANIAYTLSQLDKRVLLIDCDMRRPSISYKLPVNKTPGLSNSLTGHVDIDDIIQRCALDNSNSFDVIASGDNPPNPIELLSSEKMESVLRSLKEEYDYIIMDLPPVGEISDAMVAAKLTDGILLIVRQDYCNTVALSGAISQFEFIESHILGIVLNCVSESSGKYTRYGKGYYSKYSKSYARASKYAQDESKHRA